MMFHIKHFNKEHHKVAIVHAEEFERSMSGKQPDIQHMLSNINLWLIKYPPNVKSSPLS